MTNADEPVPGYDSLNTKEAIASLTDRTQAELAKIDTYEQAHNGRDAVFNKLRWLRQDEPIAGYDDLGADEIVRALERSDLEAIKRVRGYERKFGARREVLEQVDRLHRERRVPLVSRDAP